MHGSPYNGIYLFRHEAEVPTRHALPSMDFLLNKLKYPFTAYLLIVVPRGNYWNKAFPGSHRRSIFAPFSDLTPKTTEDLRWSTCRSRFKFEGVSRDAIVSVTPDGSRRVDAPRSRTRQDCDCIKRSELTLEMAGSSQGKQKQSFKFVSRFRWKHYYSTFNE